MGGPPRREFNVGISEFDASGSTTLQTEREVRGGDDAGEPVRLGLLSAMLCGSARWWPRADNANAVSTPMEPATSDAARLPCS